MEYDSISGDKTFVFYKFGLYNRYWNSASVDELCKNNLHCFLGSCAEASVLFVFYNISILSFQTFTFTSLFLMEYSHLYL